MIRSFFLPFPVAIMNVPSARHPMYAHQSVTRTVMGPRNVSKVKKIENTPRSHRALGSGARKNNQRKDSSNRMRVKEVGVFQEQGLRNYMEDRYVCEMNLLRLSGDIDSTLFRRFKTEPSVSVFGVFDGHSGSKAADFAVEHLRRSLIHELLEEELPPPTSQLNEAVATRAAQAISLRDSSVRIDNNHPSNGTSSSGRTTASSRARRHSIGAPNLTEYGKMKALAGKGGSSVHRQGFEDVSSIGKFGAQLRHGEKEEEVEDLIRAALHRAMEAIDDQFMELAGRNGWRDGSCALVLLLVGAKLFIANIGDCRAVLQQAGTAVRLSEDHKPNRPDEQRRVEALGGSVRFSSSEWRVYPPRVAVSRALGDFRHKRPVPYLISTPQHVTAILGPGNSFFIVASDGVWGVISDQEAVSLVQRALGRHRSAQEAAAELGQAALERGSTDNITSLVVWLQQPSFSTSSMTST